MLVGISISRILTSGKEARTNCHIGPSKVATGAHQMLTVSTCKLTMAELIAANSSHAKGRVFVKTKCAIFGIVAFSEYALSLKISSKLTSRESAELVNSCVMRSAKLKMLEKKVIVKQSLIRMIEGRLISASGSDNTGKKETDSS